jgi:hypothetical protein
MYTQNIEQAQPQFVFLLFDCFFISSLTILLFAFVLFESIFFNSVLLLSLHSCTYSFSCCILTSTLTSSTSTSSLNPLAFSSSLSYFCSILFCFLADSLISFIILSNSWDSKIGRLSLNPLFPTSLALFDTL